MRIFMILLAFCALFAQDGRREFITQIEYGKALYKNPRGIGCIKCHGGNAEGAVISIIYQNGKAKKITAPSIRDINFLRFESALKNPKGLMPSYNLTNSELVALYAFLNPNFKPPK
ncbi:c-type cytochrome [Helicobacter sp. 23-1045]